MWMDEKIYLKPQLTILILQQLTNYLYFSKIKNSRFGPLTTIGMEEGHPKLYVGKIKMGVARHGCDL